MIKTLLILGAGGHAKVVADWALVAGGWKSSRFLDYAALARQASGNSGEPQSVPRMAEFPTTEYDVFIGIGSNTVRAERHAQLLKEGYRPAVVRHPTSVVSASVALGEGTVAAPLSVVNFGSRIGSGVILNTSCSVDHDCVIGDFAHLSPGARLAGGVTIGSRCWIGIGASVIHGIRIVDDVIVGAGAAVTRDITEPGTYVGVPARRLSGSGAA